MTNLNINLETHKKLQFLVIDGDQNVLGHIDQLLKDMGHSVYLARTGEEAYTACRTKAFDIILTDLFLPGEWNGPKTAVQIRKDSHSRYAKIVAMTNKVITREIVEACVKAGMKDCINKPFDHDLMRKRLPKWTAKTKTDAINQ